MRRSELKIGKDVLVNSDRDWQEYGLSSRVRVVNLGGWHMVREDRERYKSEVEIDGRAYEITGVVPADSDRDRRPYRPINCFIGREIEGGDLKPPQAFLLLHAKVPWAEGRRIQKASRRRAREIEQEKIDEQSRRETEASELSARLAALGITWYFPWISEYDQITLTVDTVRELIEMAERG